MVLFATSIPLLSVTTKLQFLPTYEYLAVAYAGVLHF